MTNCGWNVEPLAPSSYKRLLENANALEGIGLANLSCPQLAVAPRGWDIKPRKVVLIGQETCGWGFSEPCPDNIDFTHNVSTLQQAVNLTNPIDRLCVAYANFNLGQSIGGIEATPFWKLHRRLADCLCDGDLYAVMWLNVVAVDYSTQGCSNNSMYWNLSEDQINAVKKWQAGRLRAELHALDPTDVIFVSGPYYDCFLNYEFDDLKFAQFGDFPVRKLARLASKKLPLRTFRTYHPAYLTRSGKSDFLDGIIYELTRQ